MQFSIACLGFIMWNVSLMSRPTPCFRVLGSESRQLNLLRNGEIPRYTVFHCIPFYAVDGLITYYTFMTKAFGLSDKRALRLKVPHFAFLQCTRSKIQLEKHATYSETTW